MITGRRCRKTSEGDEVIRVLSRVARVGKLAVRLRAAELIARLKLKADHPMWPA